MNIGQMFAKSINREIKPVVKPGQVDDATVKLELQEYVVTQELQETILPHSFPITTEALAQILIVSVSGFPASLEVVNLTF